MSDNFVPGSEAQLNAALSEARAVEAGVVTGPLPEPKPLQSSTAASPANAPDIRLLPPADRDGVTVDDDGEPLTFEERYAREVDHTLGTEAAPEDYFEDTGDESAEPDPDNLTPEQREIADLREQIAARDRQEILDTATWAVEDKWQEGIEEFSKLEQEVRQLGAREGRSEAEIERAAARVLVDYNGWIRRYNDWSNQQLAVAQDRANGIDEISTLITQHGLQPTDRTRLSTYAKYGTEVMESVAKDLAAERTKFTNLTTSAKRQAARNKGAALSNDAIAPPVSASPRRQVQQVQGSDAELEVMIAARPTKRGRVA